MHVQNGPEQGVGEGGGGGGQVGQCPSTFAQLTPILLNKSTAWVSQKGSECTSEHVKFREAAPRLS